jgi:hypothetical protein
MSRLFEFAIACGTHFILLFSRYSLKRLHGLYASAVPNSRARFATAASPLEPQSFKSLRRGYRTGTKERKCHGFDEEVSLPTFLCKNRKVTPFAQPEGRHFEFFRNHFHFPFVFQLRTSWTKLSAATSRPFRRPFMTTCCAKVTCGATARRMVM